MRKYINIVEGIINEDSHESIFNASVNATPSEIKNGTDALAQWTFGRKYYRPIQNLLRYGSEDNYGADDSFKNTAVPVGNKEDDHPTKTLYGMINAIDRLMNKTSLSKNMRGKRKIDENIYNNYLIAAQKKSTVIEHGFVSFSTESGVSDVIRSHLVNVFVYIGQKVIPMMHISSAPHEFEVIVARNSIWKPIINKNNELEIHLLKTP